MAIENLINLIPDYAKDLRLNLPNVLKQADLLTDNQTWGTALACALASRNEVVIREILEVAQGVMTPENLSAAKTAAALMGMNNVYYRYQHLASNKAYATIPARLRMQGIRMHGGDPVDFELWCLAVSAINGCGSCVDSHEKVLREKGMKEENILAAVRIAAVVHAVAAVVEGEAAMKAVGA